jgi:hypothetical protein
MRCCGAGSDRGSDRGLAEGVACEIGISMKELELAVPCSDADEPGILVAHPDGGV